MWGELSAAIAELARDDVAGRVESKLEAGEDALVIQAECPEGMTRVGERFQAGDRYLAELPIGGGVTTPEIKEWLGADFQTLDAAEGVAYCVETAEGE